MTKLVFISTIAAPHQIKLCESLNQYLDVEYWFYEHLNKGRPSWWKIPLHEKCTILKNLIIKRNSKYLTFDIYKKLRESNPDIVMVGGFSIPSNYLAYRWAKKNHKKTIVFTELSRDGHGVLRPFNFTWKIIKYLYRNVDFVFTSNSDATNQFKEMYGFGDKLITTRYASDLDSHFEHSIREKKDGYTYLFANRLIDIYDPALSIDIFADIQMRYPNSKLLMNSQGELKSKCIDKIESLGLSDSVSFLENIKSWNDLPKVYETADIMIFPANFSNGNFSINEAMASGMGIVISDKINGHADTLMNDENCFIVKPNKEDFLKAIQKYIDEPKLFSIHAEINRRKMQPLSINGTALFLYNILQKLGLAK